MYMDEKIDKSISDFIKDTERAFQFSLSQQERNNISIRSYEDLKSFSMRDPSSHNDMLYIFRTYLSYRAVLYYRIAHELHVKGENTYSRRISEYAKLKTGIEIHPACVIGKRFVLDHGVGTVIGETTLIGDDCYILQSVIFGSKHIAGNKSGRRHPNIGNNVEIGGQVKIYGNVNIGNNVVISPGAVIKDSIPNDSKVIVATDYQVQHSSSKILFTGYCEKENRITAYFKNTNLSECRSLDVLNNGIPLFYIVKDNSIEFDKRIGAENSYKFIFDGNDIIEIYIR